MDKETIARRMYREALNRFHDADILESTIETRSDSASFLKILALEVLLKSVVLLTSNKIPRGHDYESLWNKIPQATRQFILTTAGARMSGHADMRLLGTALKQWKRIFIKARYSYELHTDKSDAELTALGRSWLEQGGLDEEADFAYYPNELCSLLAGLNSFLESELGVKSDLVI